MTDKDKIKNEIERRRTFAIISHPDAGKTTLTEKFLLYGGAINLAGTVKGRKSARHAVSDWMDIEKERGISVTSSAMQFEYDGRVINILDTPGHQDFSEDTYRTLMAADSAVMVLDGARGVEAQTIKLFKVCVMKKIPIFTFINKFDRDALDPFDLLSNIEEVLGISTAPVNWPIGSGKNFRGVYDRESETVISYQAFMGGAKEVDSRRIPIGDEGLIDEIGIINLNKLTEDIELIEGAADELDMERVLKGELTPVFFGSALTNFGVEEFLKGFLSMSLPPGERMSDIGPIDPVKDDFSAFIFKIQANMNKAHRDRVAFMRIVSGRYVSGMELNHVRPDRKIRLSMPTGLMADERRIIEEAYAGDIIGVFDPGIYRIGDTLTAGRSFNFGGIPSFMPEHFARVRQADTMKRKQFLKGILQIAEEGAIQIFTEPNSGMEEIIAGVVGVLQLEVLTARLKSEYNVEVILEKLPYNLVRWIDNPEEIDAASIVGTSDMKRVVDLDKNPLLLFEHEWSVGMVMDRNKNLRLREFGSIINYG